MTVRVAMVVALDGGGPLSHALDLAPALRSRGVDVVAVVASDGTAQRFAERGVPAKVIPTTRVTDWRSAGALVRFVGGFDIVHCHDRRTALWLRLALRLRRRPLLVSTVHGIADPYLGIPGRRGPTLRDALVYRALEPLVARRDDRVIAPSASLAADLVGSFRWPAHSVRVIRNGIKVSGFPADGDGGSLVGCVCRLDPQKGLEVFVEAMPSILQRHPDARFAIFGDGPSRGAVLERARQLGLESVLEMPGRRPAVEALASLAVFVMPSWWENSPVALMEAMSVGLPAVATTAGGTAEILDETTGVLVPPGDVDELARGVSDLLADPDRRRAMGHAAALRVRGDFSIERCANEVHTVYEDVLTEVGG